MDTPLHLATLRGLLTFQLHELRTDLDALLQARVGALADAPAAEVTDRKDDAAAEQLSDVSEAMAERLRRELAQCESALQRLDEGRYGACVDCGEPISWPRLLAQPAAQRCTACQRIFERHAAGGGAR